MRSNKVWVFFPATLLLLFVSPAFGEISWPQMKQFLRQHDLVYEQAPLDWDQGIPLANGMIGGLIWGDGEPLKITLDRYDVWESRYQTSKDPRYNYQTLRELIAKKDYDLVRKIFYEDIRAQGPSPTRLPMGKVVIDFGPGVKRFHARLSLAEARASGVIRFNDGQVAYSVFIPDHRQVIVVEMNFGGATKLRSFKAIPAAVDMQKSLGYGAPETGTDGKFSWWRQPMFGKENYLIMWTVEQLSAEKAAAYVTITTHRDGEDTVSIAKETLNEARKEGPTGMFAKHAAWWQKFWSKSFLTVPDSRLENLFYVEMYKLGCLSRPGGLPITLQGLWTTDNVMPPWAGDYHLNMNVQESYWPVYASNHLEAGQPLYDMFWNAMPRFREFCRKFLGVEGALTPCAMDWQGSPIAGWVTVQHWPGNGPWVAHHFWLHYLYSQDKEFLRTRAYPVMREFMDMYMAILEKDAEGQFHLPLSNSPEWYGDSLQSWGKDTTCDLALIRFLGQALLQSVEILQASEPKAARWRTTLEKLAPYPGTTQKTKDVQGFEREKELFLMEGVPLWVTHRHHIHLLPIHPLGLLTVEGSDEDRRVIKNTIHWWITHGTGEWTGWSFPWASLIASRVRMPNMAYEYLRKYMDAFITENTFHVNGDYKAYGHSLYRYKPVTLEAGFASAAATMELLLQSWNGKIRLFPVIPRVWQDAAFLDLRAEGAFLVTSRLRQGKIVFADLFSEQGGPCRVANPWRGRDVQLTDLTTRETRSLGNFEVLQWATTKGTRYRLTPAGARLNAADLQIPVPKRTGLKANWFGVKTLPRF